MTRDRDREGSVLVRGRQRKFWLVPWPDGDKKLTHKPAWRDGMTASQVERARRQWMEKVNGRRDIAGDSVALEGFFREHYRREETGQYGGARSTKQPSTHSERKNAILQASIPRWGKRSMDSIETGEVQKRLSVTQTVSQNIGFSQPDEHTVRAHSSVG